MNKERAIPKVRFKSFSGDWKKLKLSSVTSRVRGNDGRMSLPTLTISARNGWLDQRERFSGNIAGKEQKIIRFYVKVNYLIIKGIQN